MNLRPVLLMLERLKEWVMLDIYGRHWRCFYKGTGLCPYRAGVGLFSFVALVILTTVTLSHLNVEELWERFYPQRPATRRDETSCLSWVPFYRLSDQRGRCPRCHIPLRLRRRHSLQNAGRRC